MQADRPRPGKPEADSVTAPPWVQKVAWAFAGVLMTLFVVFMALFMILGIVLLWRDIF